MWQNGGSRILTAVVIVVLVAIFSLSNTFYAIDCTTWLGGASTFHEYKEVRGATG